MNPNANDSASITTELSRDGSVWYGLDVHGNILAIGRTERAARLGAELRLDRSLSRQSKYDGAVR